MDPATMGITVCFLICYVLKEVGKAVADGYRSGATAGKAKTAKMRGSDHIGDNIVGTVLDGIGAVIGGTVKGAGAVLGAVGRGAKEGWQKGREKGQQIREDAKANGRPKWREAADWVRDRAQGRGKGQRRSWWERLRGWWNEGRDGASATPPGRGDDPPTDGNPGGAPPPPPPPPPPPTPPPTPPSGKPADQPQPDGEKCTHHTQDEDRYGFVTCCLCGQSWLCTDPAHTHTTSKGANRMAAATKTPSGEAKTYTQAKQAAAAYYGQVVSYQTEATDGQAKCESLERALRELHDELSSAGLGEGTMGAVSGALETASAMVRSSQQLVAHTDTAISAANRVDAALTTHAGIAEAAASNRDGGDREFHGGAAEKR